MYEEGRIERDENGSLRLIIKNEDDRGASLKGEYTCNVSNGYSFAVASARLVVPGWCIIFHYLVSLSKLR